MSGIGSGHNKFKSCKGCPDRRAAPNCHTTCRGYLYRQERQKEVREKKNAEGEFWGLKHDKKDKCH